MPYMENIMKKTNLILNIVLLLSLVFAVTACDTDLAAELQEATPTEIDPVAIFTSAAATVGAQMTQTAAAFSPTPLSPTETPVPQPTATLIQLNGSPTAVSALPTFTPIPGVSTLVPTATQITTINTVSGPLCDDMNYGDPVDITYADYSEVPAGTDFYKIWRVRNTGTCTWDDGYILIPIGSEIMAGSRTNDPNPLDAANPAFKFDTNVQPGESVDVGAKLSAPLTNGTYATHFILKNDRGYNFGGVLTVIIKVTDGK